MEVVYSYVPAVWVVNLRKNCNQKALDQSFTISGLIPVLPDNQLHALFYDLRHMACKDLNPSSEHSRRRGWETSDSQDEQQQRLD